MINILEIARRVLRTEAEAVRTLSDRLDARFERAVEIVYQSRGRVVVTGMGKSGLVGKKIAATLASTGTPAFFMHPAEAGHGDLGMVTSDDVIIALSNSGETEELINLIPFLKRFKVRLISLTGNPDSKNRSISTSSLLPKPRHRRPLWLNPSRPRRSQSLSQPPCLERHKRFQGRKRLPDRLLLLPLSQKERGYSAPMKYSDLHIETQPRQAPNNAQTVGFAFLVRAGYMTRESELTDLAKLATDHLRELEERLGESFIASLDIPILGNKEETFFPIKSGSIKVIHCPSCNYVARIELARLAKTPLPPEELLPPEKVSTPECNTIDSLASFFGISKAKTAKALMFTRLPDNKFIFVVVRGDTQLSEAKLKKHVGDVRNATSEEIAASGAAAGYSGPAGRRPASANTMRPAVVGGGGGTGP